MPAIYHEGSWLGNATDPEVLVKDTVGWTGKNRAYSQTNNAVIAHIENGITYDVSWTGAATVTLKKNSASGATITSGSTSPLSFTADADYELYFGSSATVTNIMVKDSRITDPTYEPYHESVEVMYEEEIHGVNLIDSADLANIKVINTRGTWNNNVYTDPNGCAFTIRTDGTITISSSGRGELYIPVTLKPGTYCMSSGSEEFWGHNDTLLITGIGGPVVARGNDASPGRIFTLQVTRDLIYVIRRDNLAATIYPMLRKADIEDSTYRPYNPQAIQNQLNAQGVLGAKNLLPNNATSQTKNGVTFTVNSDGTVTINGTSTAGTDLILFESTTFKGDVILSSGGFTGSAHYISVNGYNGTTYVKTIMRTLEGDNARGVIDYNGYTNIAVKLNIASGQTFNNFIVKPMLRLASDPDDTYQPYAMTNRELTEKKINIADLKTVVSASSDFADFKTRIASL